MVFLDGRRLGHQAPQERRGQGREPAQGPADASRSSEGKAATITIPKGQKPPTKTVGQPLIEGKGPKVEAGQTDPGRPTPARSGRTAESSTPARTAPSGLLRVPSIGQKQVIKGWDNQLVGKKVGSRVLLVVPPRTATARPAAPPKISGTDTLVFVVDILAAY